MSTIKVTNIEHESTANGGIQLDNAGHVTVDGQQLPTAGALSNRNLIINGAMQVNQRGDSTGITTTGYYGPDRYRFIGGGSEAYSISKSTTAPEGFSNSWKLDCTTAGSMGTSGLAILQQRIEAQNLQHLKYGTSSAVNLTASFWIRSNKTGVVTVEFYQPDDVRQIAKTITINAANTWEYKTVTIPGDTTGVIDNNNDRGLELLFWLGAGTNYTSGTHNTSAWATANNTSNRVSSNNIDISDSTANELYLTGVQLEVGEKATPFEHRSYGDELKKCKRYYNDVGDFSVRGTASRYWSNAIALESALRNDSTASLSFTTSDGGSAVTTNHNSVCTISSATVLTIGAQFTSSGSATGRCNFSDIVVSNEL